MTMANTNTEKYLEGLGLNPHDFVYEGWDEDGYFQFARDEEFGDRLYDAVAQEFLEEWRPWPEGFDFEAFTEAREKDNA